MVSVVGVVVYLVVFGFLSVGGIIACGNPYKDDVLGKASYFLQATLPSAIVRTLKSIGAQWVIDGAIETFRCCVMRRNPIVLIGYCILTFGGFVVFVAIGYPRIPNMYMAAWHKPIGLVVMAACVVTFCLSAFTSPGLITAAGPPRHRRSKKSGPKRPNAPPPGRKAAPEWCTLPYDGALYDGPVVCRTCGVVKPPRSKHDELMGGCVARYDHYCIWLNSAVGERNYRWFVLYLVCHTVMLLYGAAACASIFASAVVRDRMLERSFVNTRTGEAVPSSWWIVFQFLMARDPELMMIQLLCTVMGVVLLGFTAYHLYLAATNVTTTETFKWSGLPSKGARMRRLREYLAHRLAAPGAAKEKAARDAAAPPGREAPVPTANPYDRGVLSNLAEVFFPLSLRSREAWPRIDYGEPRALTAEDLVLQGADADDLDLAFGPAAR